jgi:Signal transduction histidine kinase, nitrate/nitrite-specific
MFSLRLRLISMFVILTLVVAGAMIVAVQRFSSEQVMHLAMQAGSSPAEAQAMFDQYVGRVLLVGAGLGLLLSSLAAWWLLRRILRPLQRLTDATRAIAQGDLAARVPAPPDPELRVLAASFNQMAATLQRVEELRRSLVEDVAHELRSRSPRCRATRRRWPMA